MNQTNHNQTGKYAWINNIKEYYPCEPIQMAKNAMGITEQVKVIALDIYGQKGRKFDACGIVGIPDVVMITQGQTPTIVVGELKGRLYNNRCRDYELNQIQLYMFLLHFRYRLPVEGRLVYKDHSLSVAFNDALCFQILANINECRASLDSI